MVFDLIQDRQGFLWFATKDGLNRYDGYSFNVFQNNPFDPFSLPDNEVSAILEDRYGRVWVGTGNNGLSIFDPGTGKFYHIKDFVNQKINCLAQTTDGFIWVGTGNGVYRIRIPDQLTSNASGFVSNASLDTFCWDPFGDDQGSPCSNTVDLMGSRDGKLWVSTMNQMGYFETSTGVYHKVVSNPNPSSEGLWNTYFREDSNGVLWAGQPGQVLRIGRAGVEKFLLPALSPFPRADLAFDAEGNLFVSTRKQIFKLSNKESATPENARFDLFYEFPKDGIIGSSKMLMDRSGLLWIGTNGYGIRKYNPGNPRFKHFIRGKSPRRIEVDLQKRIWVWHTGSVFHRLLEDENRLGEPIFTNASFFQQDCLQSKDGHIWLLCENKLGDKGKGVLIRLNGKSLVEEVRITLPVSVSISSRLYEDRTGNLWVVGNKSNLAKIDPKSTQVDSFDFGNVTGIAEPSLCMDVDADGHLWIGTPRGLAEGIPKASDFKFVLHKNMPSDAQSLNCNYILSLLNDPQEPNDYIWIGTKGGGLVRFSKQNGRFQHFTTANGLPNNVVYGVLPDEKGNLWLSTNRGLSRFCPKDASFQNFLSVDGLQDNEFNTLSYTRAPNGRLFFGGVNGITAFYPADLSVSFESPKVLITQLKINGKPIQPGVGKMQTSIEQAKIVELRYDQNQLTFEFAAMDFSAPRMNQFRYRLLGVEQNWVESTTYNSATYAHLSPGTYVFEVITGGSHGIWNGTPARLEIRILPPWWQSAWAYMFYLLAIGLSVWGGYRFQVKKIRLENKLRFEQREAARLTELDRLKSNFFSSVTHEFRTPLTLLLEPTRQLLAETKDKSVGYRLELIESNARRLFHFVNQLLDLSKLEAGQLPLDLRPGNPADLIRAVVARFQPLAVQRSITLSTAFPKQPIQVFFDEGKWEQVVSNLLSNALKFTDKGGHVTLHLEQETTNALSPVDFRVRVSDTGFGILPTELPRIFDRFYQTEHTLGGTGIGLSLTKELVECMGGSISVESPSAGERTGTTFTVMLSCTVAELEGSVLAKDLPEKNHSPYPTPPNAHPETLTFKTPMLEDQPLILLIEDDRELRQFLSASLPPGYRVAEAADGEEGIRMALELVPDLVISDLMMPRKDGFEVVEALKEEPTTSHIPFILLTAKSTIESKLQGLRRGADAYLTKPFRADELGAHIANLLASQRRIQEHFTQSAKQKTLAESAAGAFPIQENEFLQRLIRAVEENLDNETMDADAFARMVFISRSQLHRKISALTGSPLTEFVRNYRLDRAKEMLAQHNGNISEVAWRTGFSNAKYFATCFKGRFGKTPSDFVAGE